MQGYETYEKIYGLIDWKEMLCYSFEFVPQIRGQKEQE